MRSDSADSPLAHRGTVRRKLMRLSIGIWGLVLLGMLGGVAALQYRDASLSAAHAERQVRNALRDKARHLLSNQRLALRGLAVDNAFSDVRQLVTRTVDEDPDILYGTFIDSSAVPWILHLPPPGPSGLNGDAARSVLITLRVNPSERAGSDFLVRSGHALGHTIEEHSTGIFDGTEYLGTLRYGFSTARTDQTAEEERARARRVFYQTLSLIVALGATGLLFGILSVRRAALRITEPLAELSRASAEIAQGNRSVRAVVTSGDELEQLATTFNSMAETNERTMRDLELRTQEALEASRMKSEFLANMSHEIRTPMNGIVGIIRILREQSLDSGIRRYVEMLDSSASALLTIINDVLDFSKMEAGKYTLQNISFDLRSVIHDVMDLFAPRANEKGVELVYRVAPDIPPLLMGDPDRIRQVVSNLLNNAIKFTTHGSVFVNVQCRSKEAETANLRIQVNDTGIGIAERDLGKLFGAFSQVEGTLSRRFGGTGLGLAICKLLIQLMGGTFGVESRVNVGSNFWFEVSLGIAVASSALSTTARFDGRRVLLIEPQLLWQSVITEHLVVWGFQPTSVASGREALSVLQPASQAPKHHAVVSTTQLPDMPFADFLEHLRANPSEKAMPVIALYHLGSDTHLAGIESQLAAQIPKPVRVSELYNALQHALAGRKPRPSGGRVTGKRRAVPALPVLVVDDNEINRVVAKESLEQLGYTVDTAEGGAEAVQKVLARQYLVVFMDCQMPDVDGYRATRQIRDAEAPRKRHTTVIALTAHALSGERDRVLAAGMDDYLSKPVRPNALDRTIRRHSKMHFRPEPAPALRERAVEGEADTLDPNVARSAQVANLFIQQVPEQLSSLRSALANADVEFILCQAHQTRGACLSIGAGTMAVVAEQLEQAVEQHGLQDLEYLSKLLAQLESLYDRVANALRRETREAGDCARSVRPSG